MPNDRTSNPVPTPLLIALAVVLAGAALHCAYIITGPLDLSGDEAHYWDWSRRLDVGYYSKGPMVAWLIAAGTALLGHTEIGVRIPAIILGIGTTMLLYTLVQRITRSHWPALLAILLFTAHPVLSAGGMIMTIDSPFMFFWTLAALALWQAVNDCGRWWWIVAGVAGGLGFISKYTIVLLAAWFLLFMLISKRDRRHLATPWPYIAAVIALAICVPTLVWNAQHDWVSFRHTAQHNLSVGAHDTPRDAPNPLPMLGVQAANPLLLTGLLWAWGVGIRNWLRQHDRDQLFLLTMSLPVLLFMTAMGFKTTVQGNWPAPMYIGGCALLAVLLWQYAYQRTHKLHLHLRRLTVATIVVGIVLSILAHFTFIFYPLGMNPRLDPAHRLMGWAEMGRQIGQLRNDHHLPLAADDYQYAALAAFYTPGHPEVLCLNLGRRQNQYDLWPRPTLEPGDDAIYAGTAVHKLANVFSDVQLQPERTAITTKWGITLAKRHIYIVRNFISHDRELIDTDRY